MRAIALSATASYGGGTTGATYSLLEFCAEGDCSSSGAGTETGGGVRGAVNGVGVDGGGDAGACGASASAAAFGGAARLVAPGAGPNRDDAARSASAAESMAVARDDLARVRGSLAFSREVEGDATTAAAAVATAAPSFAVTIELF